MDQVLAPGQFEVRPAGAAVQGALVEVCTSSGHGIAHVVRADHEDGAQAHIVWVCHVDRGERCIGGQVGLEHGEPGVGGLKVGLTTQLDGGGGAGIGVGEEDATLSGVDLENPKRVLRGRGTLGLESHTGVGGDLLDYGGTVREGEESGLVLLRAQDYGTTDQEYEYQELSKCPSHDVALMISTEVLPCTCTTPTTPIGSINTISLFDSSPCQNKVNNRPFVISAE